MSNRNDKREQARHRKRVKQETERALDEAAKTHDFSKLPDGLVHQLGLVREPRDQSIRANPVHTSRTDSRNDGYIPPTQWPRVKAALERVESYQGHLQACSRWIESPVRFGTPRPPGLDQFSQPVLTSGILDPKVYLDPKAKGVRDAPDLFQQAVAALASRASSKPDLKSRLALVQAELPILARIADKYKLAASGESHGNYGHGVTVYSADIEAAVRDYAS